MKDKIMEAFVKLTMCPGTSGGAEVCQICPYQNNGCVAELKRHCYKLLTEVKPAPIKAGETTLDQRVTDLLNRMRVPARGEGYHCLREAIVEMVLNPNRAVSVTKELYPMIAKRYGTSRSGVEICIRRVIERTWTRGNTPLLRRIFGDTESKRPSNSEFINRIADWVRLELDMTE